MPRIARIHSQSGIYHVMLRAVNKQQIFFDEEDYAYFIGLVRRYKKNCDFILHAYCLMGNHVHFLIGVQDTPIDSIIKRIGCAFVYWYNAKYERVGHLFQDRYRSEPVEDDRYFLVVLRYILYNPIAAGLCNRLEDYSYSSAKEYILSQPGITNTEYAYSLMPDNLLRDYLRTPNEDCCMDLEECPNKKCTDSAAKAMILREFKTYYPQAGKKQDRKKLNESIRKLISEGVSIRQLSRITGLSKKIIETGLKE